MEPDELDADQFAPLAEVFREQLMACLEERYLAQVDDRQQLTAHVGQPLHPVLRADSQVAGGSLPLLPARRGAVQASRGADDGP